MNNIMQALVPANETSPIVTTGKLQQIYTSALPDLVDSLTESIRAHTWSSLEIAENAEGALRSIKKLACLSMKTGMSWATQIHHKIGELHQAFFEDFMQARGTEYIPIDQKIMKSGRRRIRVNEQWLHEEIWIPHGVNGKVPLREIAIDFLLDLVRDPLVSQLVQKVGVIEVLERDVPIDPKIVVQVGDQWYEFPEIAWYDVNTYDHS